MMEFTSGHSATCQICERVIAEFALRLRCVVAGTHSESCCLDCLAKAIEFHAAVGD